MVKQLVLTTASVVAGLGGVVACGPQVGTSDSASGSASGTGTASDGSGTVGNSMTAAVDESGDSGEPAGQTAIWAFGDSDVDILVVVDNSASMGPKQAALAESLGRIVEVLERDEVNTSWRLAVTTTDNGNPWCQGTTPEGGSFVASSCRSRLSDFAAPGLMIDATQEACLNVCGEALADITLQPSPIAGAPDTAPRPWIERIDGVSNLPAGVSGEDALGCMVPMGISGCGFEEPLEAMYKALTRATTVGEPEYGFLRDDAALFVVFVTDEVDGSYNKQFEEIYLPEGNRVFWSDPTAPSPTSAVAWNAGVSCSGSSPYPECHSVDRDVDGNPAAGDGSNAVMHPVSRYVDLLQAIADAKRDGEVVVSVISGVSGDGAVTYAEAADPVDQMQFGIGPGCTSAMGQANPPVRLREVAEAFQDGGRQVLYSACIEDYSPAFEMLVESLADQVDPCCMPGCIDDTDPTTPQIEPSCVVVQEEPQADGTIEQTNVPECLPDGEPPAGADACHIQLTGDAMSDSCIDDGSLLEFQVVRRPGNPANGGTILRATCSNDTCG